MTKHQKDKLSIISIFSPSVFHVLILTCVVDVVQSVVSFVNADFRYTSTVTLGKHAKITREFDIQT